MDIDCKFPYGFPFKPYKIQLDLMDKIYETLQNEKFGIFSSPTGTGKSLSLICSTFTWLQDYKKMNRSLVEENLDKLNKKLADLDNWKSSDWIEQFRRKSEIADQKIEWIEMNNRFKIFDLRSQELKLHKQTQAKKQGLKMNKKRKTDNIMNEQEKESLDDNLINYDSDESNDTELNEVKKEDNYVRPKLIYCSRTHSQLTQFISEIQKTEFKDKFRVLTLGSRLNLCVNPKVNKSKNLNVINDKCLDLQRKNRESCCFNKQNEIKNLRDEMLSTIMDIEEAYETGKQFKCCPYYAGRYAIQEAEVLVVPYNLLLHDKTRESMNLKLNESIVIVDEAHNLLDAISSIHSIEIKGSQLIDCLSQITQYQLRYNTKLNAKNMMYIKQLITIINLFIKYIQRQKESKVLNIIDLDLECGIENFNLYNIINFCEKSQLQRKLFGFVLNKASETNVTSTDLPTTTSGVLSFLERMKNEKKCSTTKNFKIKTQVVIKNKQNLNKNELELDRPTSLLHPIIEFLKSITTEIDDSRIIITIDKQSVRKSSFKFILLNPAKKLENIVKKSRSIILIGGTMEPINQFTNILYACNSTKSINQFACDHVIPDENLFVSSLASGPSKIKFDFIYHQRFNSKMLTELGNLLVQICATVEGGIVVFFVSYDFEEKIYQHFKSNKFIDQFEKQGKQLFREPRNSNDVNQVLTNYTKSVHQKIITNKSQVKKTGAILFSVVGGKMSEGINFNDDLGRCVVMIGLPYANIRSIELREKMTYIEKQFKEDGKRAANDYYENLCMRAVNQSIGRAIRHQKDYASILLVDYRYVTKESVINALPGWIRRRRKAHENFDDCLYSLKQFFSNKAKIKKKID